MFFVFIRKALKCVFMALHQNAVGAQQESQIRLFLPWKFSQIGIFSCILVFTLKIDHMRVNGVNMRPSCNAGVSRPCDHNIYIYVVYCYRVFYFSILKTLTCPPEITLDLIIIVMVLRKTESHRWRICMVMPIGE